MRAIGEVWVDRFRFVAFFLPAMSWHMGGSSVLGGIVRVIDGRLRVHANTLSSNSRSSRSRRRARLNFPLLLYQVFHKLKYRWKGGCRGGMWTLCLRRKCNGEKAQVLCVKAAHRHHMQHVFRPETEDDRNACE